MTQRGPWLLLAAALAALAGCNQINLGPPRAASAPPAPSPAPLHDLTPFVGDTYAGFVARPEFVQHAAALALTGADQARLNAAMAAPAPGWIATGGGARALVFTGCAASGCEAALAVVAIGSEPGVVFIGVRDSEGRTELIPNVRLEALLRLSSPERSWESPAAPAPSANP